MRASPHASSGAICAAALTLSLLAPHRAGAADWSPLGAEGVSALRIEYDAWHDRLLLATVEGFRIYDFATGEWEEHDEEGWIGRTVWTIIGHETLPNRLITGRENAFFKGYLEVTDTRDENGTIAHFSDGGSFRGLARDPVALDRYYACSISDITAGEFMVSTDAGVSWTPVATGMSAMTGVAVGRGEDVYLSGLVGVRRSLDRGATWESWTTGVSGLTELVEVTPEALVPNVYTAVSSGLYSRATDGTMFRRELPFPITALDVERVAGLPGSAGETEFLAAITASEVYFAVHGYPATHADETGSLDGLALADVTIAHGMVFVATQLAGVWSAPLTLPVVSVPETPPASRLSVSPSENPLRAGGNVSFTVPSAGFVRLEAFDVAGRHVATLFEGRSSAGTRRVRWDEAMAPPGIYYVVLRTGTGTAAGKITLVRR